MVEHMSIASRRYSETYALQYLVTGGYEGSELAGQLYVKHPFEPELAIAQSSLCKNPLWLEH